VRVGQAAQVTVTLLDGFRTLSARVSRVDPQVKDGVFQIELEFVGKPSVELLEGQALDGRVMLGDDSRALVAPAGPWLDAAGGNWVMVLEPQGRFAERRPVKTGKRSEAQVEVLSGLKAGESIVTSSYETFDKIQKLEFSK
jgi:HlyD family secretion protein